MPQKRNPDVLELTRANSGVLQAHLERVLLVIGKLPSSYHRDYQLTKEPLIRGLRLARDMARAMELATAGLEVDRERCAAALAPAALAAHRALVMTRDGTPFREAYRRVGEELARGETPQAEGDVTSLYAVEGSAGDLRLAEGGQRLVALSDRVNHKRAHTEERLRALENDTSG